MTPYEQDALDARLQAAAARLGSRSNRLNAADSESAWTQIAAAREYVYSTGALVSVAETFVLAIESRVFGTPKPKPRPAAPPKPGTQSTVPAPVQPIVATMAAPGDWFGTLPPLGKAGVVAAGAVVLWWLWRSYASG